MSQASLLEKVYRFTRIETIGSPPPPPSTNQLAASEPMRNEHALSPRTSGSHAAVLSPKKNQSLRRSQEAVAPEGKEGSGKEREAGLRNRSRSGGTGDSEYANKGGDDENDDEDNDDNRFLNVPRKLF